MQVGAKCKRNSPSGMDRKCLSLPRSEAKSGFKAAITWFITVSDKIFLVCTCPFLGRHRLGKRIWSGHLAQLCHDPNIFCTSSTYRSACPQRLSDVASLCQGLRVSPFGPRVVGFSSALNYETMVGVALLWAGLPLKQMTWLTAASPHPPTNAPFVLLQNGVGGGEDADQLVRIPAAQISQGNAASVLAARRRRCHSDGRWCSMKIVGIDLGRVAAAACLFLFFGHSCHF